MLTIDLERSQTELLEDVRNAAAVAINNNKPAAVAVPLAVLLTRLSMDAAATAAKMERLTKWLIGLTWALTALTVTIIGLEVHARFFL